ncbi:endonuclease domain-containing protein [Candidatus Uhrbacteria bacterium]|nr:endonuclease domain-containing protein [Candidatus Uhrbacteria bacterium]
MTEAEVRVWNIVRKKQIGGFVFYRQRPIGKYIVDFFCPARQLVIEIDGGQHYTLLEQKRDKVREEYLGSIGLHVLRFTNIEVMKNIEGVHRVISQFIENPP